jgi:hypothetical protein
MIQAGEGIRADGIAVQGGSVQVQVGPNDSTVEVSVGGSSDSTSHDVSPGKGVTIPVPPVPQGTILYISVGKGLRRRLIVLEVIAPTP